MTIILIKSRNDLFSNLMPSCMWPDFIEIIGIISWRGLGSIVFERRVFGFLVMLHLWMSFFVMYVLREYDHLAKKFNKSMKATSSTNWTICHIFVDHNFCSKSIWKLEIFVNSTAGVGGAPCRGEMDLQASWEILGWQTKIWSCGFVQIIPSSK